MLGCRHVRFERLGHRPRQLVDQRKGCRSEASARGTKTLYILLVFIQQLLARLVERKISVLTPRIYTQGCSLPYTIPLPQGFATVVLGDGPRPFRTATVNAHPKH